MWTVLSPCQLFYTWSISTDSRPMKLLNKRRLKLIKNDAWVKLGWVRTHNNQTLKYWYKVIWSDEYSVRKFHDPRQHWVFCFHRRNDISNEFILIQSTVVHYSCSKSVSPDWSVRHSTVVITQRLLILQTTAVAKRKDTSLFHAGQGLEHCVFRITQCIGFSRSGTTCLK